jgi:hypothetical protein
MAKSIESSLFGNINFEPEDDFDFENSGVNSYKNTVLGLIDGRNLDIEREVTAIETCVSKP